MNFIEKHQNKWAKHRNDVAAKQQGSGVKPKPSSALESEDDEVKQRTEFKVLCQTISADQNALRTQFANHPERNAATPKYLEKYREYCEAALKEGAEIDAQDPVIVQCAIWATNCAEFDLAMKLATVGKAMQSGMQRDLPHLVFDMVQQDSRATDDDRLAVLKLVEDEVWTINHAARAKLYKWAAQHFEESDLSKACGYAEKAHETYPNVGVKTFMETLQKRVSGDVKDADKPAPKTTKPEVTK